ncbi:hypothetical protein ACFX2J_022900 [Malus domestica]
MIFKIDGLFFQLHSSLLVSSARCLHMLQGIIFTCLICSSGRCSSFFESTATVGDEYSRAVLDRQSGKGSKQSVPYPSSSGSSGILFSLSLSL